MNHTKLNSSNSNQFKISTLISEINSSLKYVKSPVIDTDKIVEHPRKQILEEKINTLEKEKQVYFLFKL
jgi:hypothetical protein